MKHIFYRNLWQDRCPSTELDLIKISVEKKSRQIDVSLLGHRLSFIFDKRIKQFYKNVTYKK